MLHLLYGDEDLLVQEELARLKESLGPPDLISLNTEGIEAAQATFNEIQSHCSTIAFLAPARLVIVSGLLSRFGRDDGGQGGARTRGRGRTARVTSALTEWEALPELVAQMPETTHLVFTDGSITRTNPLLALLAPHAKVQQFSRLRGEALESWMRERVLREQASLAPGAGQLLLQLAGDNLRVIANEVAKLALYAEAGTITKEDVAALVPQAQDATIFELVGHVAASATSKAEQALHALLKNGSAPPYLLFLLARQFRLLIQAKGFQQQGIKGSALRAEMGINSDYAFEKVLAQERRYTMPALERAMERLLEADIALKTGAQQGEIALELLVLDLCRAGSPASTSRR